MSPHDHLFVVNSAGRAALTPGPSDSIRAITTPDFDLHYVLRGHGALVIDGRRFNLVEGDFCLVRPGETFLVAPSGEAFERCYIHFDAVRLDTLRRTRDPEHLFPFRVFSAGRNSLAFLLCVRIVREFRGRERGALGLCAAYLTELLTQLVRRRSGGSAAQSNAVRKNLARLVAVRQFIESHLEGHLALGEIARTSGLSVNHLSRLFKQYLGYTPSAYLMRCRIERAKELLIENTLSVSEIAYQLGFEDAHYFSRAFKRWAKLSPTQYLTQIQGDFGHQKVIPSNDISPE